MKDTIYGRRLVLFAPLYVSNMCGNECTYCAFRARNRALARRALSQEEIAREVRILIDQGHKRVLLVAGESYPTQGFSYVLECDRHDLRREARQGRDAARERQRRAAHARRVPRAGANGKIGTYQLFQETYHHDTYASVHVGGKKRDYDWRVTAMDRAMEAGINDVGIGVLFGLFDWRFELLALLQHIRPPRSAGSASARTRSACRGWSRRPGRTWRRTRRTP